MQSFTTGILPHMKLEESDFAKNVALLGSFGEPPPQLAPFCNSLLSTTSYRVPDLLREGRELFLSSTYDVTEAVAKV